MSHESKESINQQLRSIGELLKARRMERNLSLKEAENATSIRMSHIQALEEGEIHKIPSPVYAQGFLRQYANYLGLDGEQILRQHPEPFKNGQKQHFDYGIGTIEARGNPGSGVKWFPNAAWILAFLALFAAAWYLAKHLEIF